MKSSQIKGFCNLHLHTDVVPFEVVSVISDKTIEIREMSAVPDPNWKPEIVVGGFAGHCTNQHTQKWIYESDMSNPVIRCRKVKPTYNNNYRVWKSSQGFHKLTDEPFKFHDYNF